MQICESPAVYPIISLPCRSLSQSHHHDTFFLFIKWFHGAFVYWNIQLIYRNFNLLCKCFFSFKKRICKCFLAWIFREHVLPTIRSIFVLLVPNSQRTLCEFCGLNSWSKPQWTCMEGRYLILNNYFRLFSTSCFYHGISLSVGCFEVVLHFRPCLVHFTKKILKQNLNISEY